MCIVGLRALFLIVLLALLLRGLPAEPYDPQNAPGLRGHAPAHGGSPSKTLAMVDGKMVESVPPGMSSLTFVFDRTGSMNDDLNQVRQGAKGIFETVMKQRKKFIYNYVLVTFHDPGHSRSFLNPPIK